MIWIVYELNPIDYGWSNLRTVQQTIAEIANTNEEAAQRYEVNADGVRDFLSAWDAAQLAASGHGWEGDFREPPRVFWLPKELSFEHGFVFKQDNNGATFVVSPQELPSLGYPSVR